MRKYRNSFTIMKGRVIIDNRQINSVADDDMLWIQHFFGIRRSTLMFGASPRLCFAMEVNETSNTMREEAFLGDYVLCSTHPIPS